MYSILYQYISINIYRDKDGHRLRHSSSHRSSSDRKNYSGKRRSSRERSYSEDIKRRNSGHGAHLHREYRRRSIERRERERSLEKREREKNQSNERIMPTLPGYLDQAPVPIYYGVRNIHINNNFSVLLS